MNLKSNIWKLYVIKGFRWFMIVMPIIVLFFQENGLSMKEVLLLQAIFSLSVVVLEVPSGYFADIIGRKASIVAGTILGTIGFSIYSFSYSFAGFLAAELIIGFGSSFISGADSALLYDTLVKLKKTKSYTKFEGKLSSIGNFSEGIASIFGGFVALISLRTPFYIETIVGALAIPFALSLIEPKRHKPQHPEGNFAKILKIVKYSMHDHREIKWLIIYSALVSASTLTMVWFIQPYWNLVGVPLALFGILWAVLQFSVGIFSLYAYKYENFLGRKTSLISLILLSVTGYVLLYVFQTRWAIVFIFIFYFVRGIASPVLKDYVNKLISSDIRATVLSVKNMVSRLIFAIIGPFIGWTADVYTLPYALLLSGSLFLVSGVLSLLFLRKHKGL
jgi:MFS family permease